MPVASVIAVHEEGHQGTCEDQEIRQKPQRMSEVLGPEQKPHDEEQNRANEKCARGPETTLGPFVMMLCMVVHGHACSPIIRRQGGRGTCPWGTQTQIRRAPWARVRWR